MDYLSFFAKHSGAFVVLIGSIVSIFITRRKARNNDFFLYSINIFNKKESYIHNAGFFSDEKDAKNKVNSYLKDINDSDNYSYRISRVPINMWFGRVDNTVYRIKGWDGSDEFDMNKVVEYYYFTPEDKLDELMNNIKSSVNKDNWTYSGYELNKFYEI